MLDLLKKMKEINIKEYYASCHFLYSVEIEITTKCNFNCIHCYLGEHIKYGLSKEKLFDLLAQLRKMGVYEIQFTGGEPFIRNDFLEIVKYARELYFKVVILTNISLLNDEIINELEQLHVECISTTLFSLNDDVNDKITNKNQSANIVKSNLLKLKKTSIRTEVKTVVMKQNKIDFHSIKKFCNNNQIDYLATEGVFPMMDGSLKPLDYALEPKDLRNCIEELDEIRFGRIFYKNYKNEECICCEQRYSLFIDATGNIYPCNMWFRKIGNINENTLENIWNDSFLQHIRSETRNSLKKCLNCDSKNYCIRCSGIAETTTGDYCGIDPHACIVSRIRKNIKESQ